MAEAESPQSQSRSRPGVLGGSGFSLFRLSGIEVRIDYTWFFIFLLILLSLAIGYFPRAHPELGTASYWAAGVVATVLFFGSVVAHEFAHALMAQRLGIPVPSITLFLFGGVSQMAEEPEDPATELKVAIVGPLTSIGLAVVFFGIHRALAPVSNELVAGVPLYLCWINLALGVFNLLPGLPLDGGRLLRAFGWWRTGSLRRGTRIAANAGKGIAIGLMLLGALQIFGGALIGGLWLVLIGLFLRGTAEAGYQNLVLLQTLEDEQVGGVAIRDPVTLSPQLPLQEVVDDYFLKHGYRAFPVVEGQNVLGILSIDALSGLSADDRREATVKDHMTPISEENTVSPDLPLADAMKKLPSAAGGRLLVMRNDELVGLLTKEALLRFIEIRNVLDGDR